MWNGLVGVAKETYTPSLDKGGEPRPLMMPLMRGELVGLMWARPLSPGQDMLAGIAAAAGADKVVLAWETHDVTTACELPVVGPVPRLNLALATRNGYVLHQFPYNEQLLSRNPEGWTSVTLGRRPTFAPRPGGEPVPPIQAAVNFSFAPSSWTAPTRSASPWR
ncbi:hypothetical protein SAMN05428939_8108 [Streptomyces sp. TLI_105]|nr:hypothetical protein SAMN05428939_8108 [Streptomyces sp. TLI_105]